MDDNAVLQRSLHNKVLTLCFNDPRRKNAWGSSLLNSVLTSFEEAANDSNVAVVVLTGRGDYYCSGVDFVSSFPVKPPRALAAHLEVANQKLFDTFLDFPKPLIVAANGPSIGAAVTSATLCDAILAHPTATFHTPFAALGIVPEGCSSVWFAERMGADAAARMLGDEGWCPNAAEAQAVGLVKEVVSDVDSNYGGPLRARAQALGEQWIREGKKRFLREHPELRARLKAVNKTESAALAAAFVSPRFLNAMHANASAKGKKQLAAVFAALKHTEPLWSKL